MLHHEIENVSKQLQIIHLLNLRCNVPLTLGPSVIAEPLVIAQFMLNVLSLKYCRNCNWFIVLITQHFLMFGCKEHAWHESYPCSATALQSSCLLWWGCIHTSCHSESGDLTEIINNKLSEAWFCFSSLIHCHVFIIINVIFNVVWITKSLLGPHRM